MKKIHYLLHPKKTRFSIFLLTIAGFYFADTVMTYIFPVAVEEALGSNLRMGIVMGLSSMAGLVCDFTLPAILRSKTWRFYFLGGIFISLVFPLLTSIGYVQKSFLVFALASIVWGIYFELLIFSIKEYIFEEEDKFDYARDWGLLYTTMQVLEIIAPIVGAFLLITVISSSVLMVIPMQILSLVVFLITANISKRKNIHKSEEIKETPMHELRVWFILIRNLFPALMAGFILISYDAIFWTIGALLGEQIFGSMENSWIVVTLYSIATLLGPMILLKFKITHRKKLLTIIAIFIASISTTTLLLDIQNPILITTIIFVSALIISFARPLNDAVISDYLLRLGKNRYHLLGISNATGSTAFIIVPILAGFLSDNLNYKTAIGVYGVIILIISIILFFITPRKIKIHQKEIKS